MHPALLTNRAWLDEELAPFQHLVVGLIDEGVRVAQVVPEGVSHEDLSSFGEQVWWRESRVSTLNYFRLAGLNDTLTDMGVDLIHAMDGRLWRAALNLAEAMSVPAILSAYSKLDIRLAQRLLAAQDPSKVAVTTATEPLTGAIREVVSDNVLVRTIPPGVHVHQDSQSLSSPEQALCVIVSGNGEMDEDYQILLDGIARFIRSRPMTQFFFDGQGSTQHQIWKAANAAGLLGNISLTPRRLGHREVLLKAHAIIHPQPLGRARSLTLRAMARGMPVIARQDPFLDYLIDGETAVVLENPDASQWVNVLDRLVEDVSRMTELGQRAMDWVRRHRTTSQYVAGVLDMYRRMTGESIPFSS
ncbi:MAG: hypothetical protein Kow00105_06080 [Phycisphaeraceae bacterium]